MAENVFIIKFEEESKSYQTFSELKQMHATKQIVGEQMGVILNDADAGIQIKDFLDFTGTDKTARGSIIGALVGIIGGPLGILLGWMGGTFIGATGDAREIKNAMNVFEQVTSFIAHGQTGVIILAREEDFKTIQDYTYNLGRQVVRLNGEYVKDQIKQAQLAQFELERDARKRWKDQNK